MIEIVAASGNAGKIAEIAAAFAALPVKVVALQEFAGVPEVEETGLTFADNALLKARHYSQSIGKPCLADDSGLEVDALDGAPGVFSARYSGPGATDAANNEKLLAALREVPEAKRTARFRCVLAFAGSQGEPLLAEGTCEGIILKEARGSGGFGYDPLFYVPALGKTLSELTLEEKNGISHRGQALRHMAEKLAGYFDEDRGN